LRERIKSDLVERNGSMSRQAFAESDVALVKITTRGKNILIASADHAVITGER